MESLSTSLFLDDFIRLIQHACRVTTNKAPGMTEAAEGVVLVGESGCSPFPLLTRVASFLGTETLFSSIGYPPHLSSQLAKCFSDIFFRLVNTDITFFSVSAVFKVCGLQVPEGP